MDNPTACLLVIGNEVLSGRTRDANLQMLAGRLAAIGVPLREARVIPDVADVIVATLEAVRPRFDHVFTTGGIGPTHDDITSACVARAFGVPWEPHPEAWALLEAHYAAMTPPGDFNAARQRMATLPRGATLIPNAVSVAPGFTIGNVHVLAGVPRICAAMVDALLPTLAGGPPVSARALHGAGLLEGRIAADLAAIQARHPQLDLGSYPYDRGDGSGVALVARGTDAAALEAAAAEIAALMRAHGAEPREGEPA